MRICTSILLLAAVLPASSWAAGQVLVPDATIALPGVKGRIDHFAVDIAGRRLFVAALGNGSVEVLDIERNRREASLPGFGEPQGLLFENERLYVANGSGNRLDILDGRTLSPIAHVEELDDADNVRYDAAARTVIVGYGTGALRVLGADGSDIPLPGHPESFQLESNGRRIFVNVPTARQVAVVDRSLRRVIATWPTARAGGNFPMAFDEAGQRLFVGARSPATLLVYDTVSGKQVAALRIGGDTDDLFFDAQRKRIYVICGEGRVDVLRQDTPDRYSLEGSRGTAHGARTGLFVPSLDRLYVAAPADGSSPARVLVFRAE